MRLREEAMARALLPWGQRFMLRPADRKVFSAPSRVWRPDAGPIPAQSKSLISTDLGLRRHE
jgi:hypothetical protein